MELRDVVIRLSFKCLETPFDSLIELFRRWNDRCFVVDLNTEILIINNTISQFLNLIVADLAFVENVKQFFKLWLENGLLRYNCLKRILRQRWISLMTELYHRRHRLLRNLSWRSSLRDRLMESWFEKHCTPLLLLFMFGLVFFKFSFYIIGLLLPRSNLYFVGGSLELQFVVFFPKLELLIGVTLSVHLFVLQLFLHILVFIVLSDNFVF